MDLLIVRHADTFARNRFKRKSIGDVQEKQTRETTLPTLADVF